ncbi:MAG: oligosaccharide flippase family protein [Anaerolineae bacterium]
MKSARKIDTAILFFLLMLPLLWFAPQALGGRTLLPADNLFAFEPWRSFGDEQGVVRPYNSLISDLILENYAWKSFILEALRAGDLAGVLWNPRLFAGMPFLAAGQHSGLYPLSILFYILPLWRAYGTFTWLQLGLAAINMYVFARVLGLRRPAAVFSAVVFAFSGFFIVSVNFTMIIAAAAWLPLILAMIEIVVQKQLRVGRGAYSPMPYMAAGALFLGVSILAGHVEITYYNLLVSGFYAAWRLITLWRELGDWRPAFRLGGWLLLMVALGLGLGAVQFIPLYELVTQSFREGSASLQQVREWAWPSRQIITFLLPDAFGNPTHHSYFDIWRRVWTPVTQNALGEPLRTIDWGVKNYVEGGNYLGIPTLLLAMVAVFGQRGRRAEGYIRASAPEHRSSPAPFAVLAVLSLLFAFGTPLYAILYYGLPGYSQLHSAFRWVFPYTLSMAVLAGYGLNLLIVNGERRSSEAANDGIHDTPYAIRILGGLSLIAGAGALAAVLLSVFVPGPFVALGERLLTASDLARQYGYADGAMAWSHQAVGLARFGLIALLAGGALAWGGGQRIETDKRMEADERMGSLRGWFYLSIRCHPLLLVLVLDLWLFGHAFNPATDPKLLDFTPPVIQFLKGRQDTEQPWRLTSFDAPGEKVLNANSAMPHGLEDVRGYDSIIPKQYVAYMERIQRQDDLLYNRIAPIYTQMDGQPNYDALDSPLLDLLGVKYVVTTHTIPNPGYELVYDAEVKVYENKRAFPRVFVVPKAIAATDQAQALDLLQTVDPAQVVVIEGITAEELPPPASPQLREARISQRRNREVFVDVNISDRGWLVFTDNYFSGWKAYLRQFGATGEGINATGESIEQQLTLYRADGTFRAVYLPEAGQWTVRFVYSPRSFLLGLYTSFLATVTLLLLAGWWAWGRYYRGPRSEMGTVAKNSAVQVAMSLLNKAIDFAFAMLRLRVLSPVGEGSYVFAIAFYGIFEILTRFGLGTLVTRDVAIDRSRARAYLANTFLLRTGLWFLSLPIMAIVALFYRVALNQLTGEEAQAIVLFALALLFANFSDAITAIFNAFEKMEHPASIATAIATAKVALGALVLLPPFDLGFVGLAGVSLVMNIVQMAWLWVTLRSKVFVKERGSGEAEGQRGRGLSLNRSLSLNLNLDLSLQRYMLRESGPLMINNLLATVFWRISQFVLRGATNPAALGIFSAGIKWLDGLNVIPAYFTLAIFPLLSRYAHAGKGTLARSYRLAVQLLFMTALPVAVFFTFAATPLIRILGGAAYLPDSAVALRIMIWSIPIGFINSVTQYVLIAVNQQRFLTRAFIIGVAFTTLANLIFIPRFGYVAAAVILIPAELSLFIPFTIAVHRHVAAIPWPKLLAPPLLAAGLDVASTWSALEMGMPPALALTIGFAVYLVAIVVLGVARSEEFMGLRNLLRRR